MFVLLSHQINKQKTDQVTALQGAIKERDTALHNMREKFTESGRNFAKLKNAYETLESEKSALKQVSYYTILIWFSGIVNCLVW